VTRVAVVIPNWNGRGWLPGCLDSLAAQSRRADEVIVVDNGSADGSAEVARAWGGRVLAESAPGIGAAAATGYDAATGDLIARLDADTLLGPGWTTRALRDFAVLPGLDGITGPAVFTGVPPGTGAILADWYLGIYFRGLGRRIGFPPLFGSNLVMRQEAWAGVSGEVHRFDQETHDDLDVSIHLGLAGRRLAVDRGLVVRASGRPLAHPLGMIGRARKAEHTIRLHDLRRGAQGPSKGSGSGHLG
jgi:glycosyltransferase involved in cell wall biosynthesis